MASCRRDRGLALLLATALGCVASAPCPRTIEGSPPSAHAHAESESHAHLGSSDTAAVAPPEAHAHHGSHAHHTARPAPERAADAAPDSALSAPCTCGCQDDSAPSAAGARLGEALRRAPPDPLACPVWDTAIALHPTLPDAPFDARDPVPI